MKSSFQAYLLLLQRYALLLLLTLLTGLGLAIWLLFFVVTPVYQAETSLLLLQGQPGNLSSLVNRLESQLDRAGPLRNLILPSTSRSSLEDLISILKSRSLSEKVASELPLRSLKEVQKSLIDAPSGQETRLITAFLQENTTILSPDSRDHTLRIQVEMTDPSLAAQTANRYVQELKSYLVSLTNQEQNQQLNFLKQQARTLEKELQTREEELLAFQQRNRTVSLSDEIEGQIKSLAELEAQELSAQAALKAAQARRQAFVEQGLELAPESTAERNALELELAGLRERQQALSAARQRYQQSLLKLPTRALELARLQRQVTLKSQLYLILQQQIQAAQLDADRKLELFRVLDPALEPLEPVKPAKGLWLAISAIISIGLGIFMASVHDYLSSSVQKESASDEPISA